MISNGAALIVWNVGQAVILICLTQVKLMAYITMITGNTELDEYEVETGFN